MSPTRRATTVAPTTPARPSTPDPPLSPETMTPSQLARRRKIIDAASKQVCALEAFVRHSHEQTQRVLDVASQRIAELEAEIERCRQASAQASREGEERARTVNNEMVKVQRVLEFFGDLAPSAGDDLDEVTFVNEAETNPPIARARPRPTGQS